MPIVSSARPAGALVTRTSSLPRYMGIPTPGTFTQITGFDPEQLATATRMLRDEGYFEQENQAETASTNKARSGISWNCAWPMHGKALDAAAVGALSDLGLLAACVAAIGSQLPSNLSLQLVLPVLPEPLGIHLGWPSIDAVVDRITSNTSNAQFVLDPHRGLDYRAVWEIKKRWPRLDLHLDCTLDQSVQLADLERHRDAGGMNGVVIGRAVTRDPLVLGELAAGLGLLGKGMVDVDEIIHNYAVYADVVQDLYGYPYPIHDLLIPLAHVLRGAQGKAFRSALLQPNYPCDDSQNIHARSSSSTFSQPPISESTPGSPERRSVGPMYHLIMAQVDQARGASLAGKVRSKFGLPWAGLRAGGMS
ncbi:hypothetical protein BCR44DRAFT_44233, partial [Catenaria anguillulae PL171]